MKKILKTPKNPQKCKNLHIAPSQYLLILFALLGLAMFMTLIFMILWFAGEKLGIVPVLSVWNIDGLTEGENWIVFMASFVLIWYIGLLILWFIYRAYRTWYCADIEQTLETPLFK